jgi:FecR protein
MSNSNLAAARNVFGAVVVAAALFAAAVVGLSPARAAGACALIPNERMPSEKILQCGATLTVRPAQGARYQPLYKKGDPLPVAIRLNEGALLIEYHPASPQEKFQILTPLAIAAVRGTKWAMEVVPGRTSTLVLSGAVAVTNRRLNQYVVLTWGQGVDITPADTSIVQKLWGEARVRALLSRFGE